MIWSALRGELERTDPDLLADAGERLSLVAELVRAAVLRRGAESEPEPRDTRPPLGCATRRPHRVRGRRPPIPGAGRGVEDGGVMEGENGVGGATGRAAGDPLWIGTLRDEIVRAARARLPLSLLLVELDEADRLLAAGPRSEASATFGRFAQAVRTALRHRDVLACETESRAWIIARETARAGAQALGLRIVTTVPSEESWRGAPLTVSVGLAVLGEDGHNAAALIDAAEQMRFAAEASGVGIVTDEPGDGGSEPPTPGRSFAS